VPPTAPLNLTQKFGAHHRARPLIASETRRALITAADAGGGGADAGGDATRLTGQLRPASVRDECVPFAPPPTRTPVSLESLHRGHLLARAQPQP